MSLRTLALFTYRVTTLPIVQGYRPDQGDGDRRKTSRDTPDRRNFPRQRIFKGADAIWHKGAFIDCVVHNISVGGACLQVNEPIPDVFLLVLDDDPQACRVVWRKANRVGVRFLR